MLNQSNFITKSGTTRKTILIDQQNSTALSCKIAAGADLKAGTPLTGNLKSRDTAFTKATGSNAVGILVHDVNAKDEQQNAQVLIFGFVDISKLDADVQQLITPEVEAALNMIKFVK